MSGLFLGIDIGTSSSKGVVTDERGRVLASASRAHGTASPQPGWFEHDPEAVWWADFLALTRELVPRAGAPVDAVCVSGIGPCLLVADRAGRPLRPAILYGVDTRAWLEVDELTERLGAERILARAGSALSSQAVGPKLLWVQKNEPEVWRQTRRFFMASSFVVHRLTDRYVLDHHSASQCDPLYDIEHGAWGAEWPRELAPTLELPELLWPAETAGRVTAEAASLTGLAEGTPVATGTIDAWSEALSVGVSRPGDAMLMYGTSLFIVRVTERPMRHRSLWSTSGVLPSTHCLAAGMSTGGALTTWTADLTSTPLQTLIAEAEHVAPGCDGLLTLPYFAGERTPILDPHARGVLFGLTLAHGRAHLYRSVLEGTAFAVRHNLEAMADAGAAISGLAAVGGGTNAEIWLQIVSDVTGVPQRVPTVALGACYGDSMLAAATVGHADALHGWNDVGRIVEPRPDLVGVYGPRYRMYRDLYAQTRGLAHLLSDPQDASEPRIVAAVAGGEH